MERNEVDLRDEEEEEEEEEGEEEEEEEEELDDSRHPPLRARHGHVVVPWCRPEEHGTPHPRAGPAV